MRLEIESNINKVILDVSKIPLTNSESKQAFENIGTELVEYFKEDAINAQGAKTGGWKSLASSTVLARSNGWGYYKNGAVATDKTLVWTGKLKSSFKKTVSSVQLVISNTAKYFKHHQLGGKKLPKRKILVVNKDVQDKVISQFNKVIEKKLKKLFQWTN